MDIIYDPVFLTHETGNHTENSKRLLSFSTIPETSVPADESCLSLVHTKEYVEYVRRACRRSVPLDADTATSPGSFAAAVGAVNAAIVASQKGGFALVRPPGHHAYPDHGAGFCLFNNIAIAVEKLVAEGKRVLIFDFDGHCGDGTETIFYSRNDVLYWSLHQYPAYPMKGTVDEIGSGIGTGYTINVPLPPRSGDDVYLHVVYQILPIALQFKPDVVAVSAGFDGHKDDALLDLALSAQLYWHIGNILRKNFPYIFATLEGGYNLEVLPACVYNFLDGVNGEPARFVEKPTVSTEAVVKECDERLEKLMTNMRPYWKT